MLPAAYQPRVKDLAAPGDGLLDGLEEQGRRGVLCAAVDGASDATQPLSVQVRVQGVLEWGKSVLKCTMLCRPGSGQVPGW